MTKKNNSLFKKRDKPDSNNKSVKISDNSKNINKKGEGKSFINGGGKKKFTVQPKQQNDQKKDQKQFMNGAGKKINKEENKETKTKPLSGGISKKNKKVKVNEAKVAENVSENSSEPNVVLSLDKRNKNRLKCEMKKEMKMKGLDPAVVLSKKSLLEYKLRKLEAKPEPRGVKVQKKILLIKKLLSNLKEVEGAKQNNAAAKKTEGKEAPEGDVVNKPKKKKRSGKKAKKETTEDENKDNVEKEKKNFPKSQFVVFVGNLPVTITKEMLLEAFEDVEGIEKVRLPRKRAGKTRRFAYVQVENEEARVNLLKKHGTQIEGKPVNIFYADRKKGKSMTPQNMQLMEQRKLAAVSEDQIKEIGKQLQKKKMNEKKKKQEEEEDSDSD